MSSAGEYSFDDLHEGMEYESSYLIDSEVYNAFLATFHDTSPIHVNDGFAQANGFKRRVMHGAILNGFLSQFIGLCFPGTRGLLLTCDIRYLKPTYLGDTIRVKAKIMHRLESKKVVTLDVEFYDENEDYTAASSRVQVALFG